MHIGTNSYVKRSGTVFPTERGHIVESGTDSALPLLLALAMLVSREFIFSVSFGTV